MEPFFVKDNRVEDSVPIRFEQSEPVGCGAHGARFLAAESEWLLVLQARVERHDSVRLHFRLAANVFGPRYSVARGFVSRDGIYINAVNRIARGCRNECRAGSNRCPRPTRY